MSEKAKINNTLRANERLRLALHVKEKLAEYDGRTEEDIARACTEALGFVVTKANVVGIAEATGLKIHRREYESIHSIGPKVKRVEADLAALSVRVSDLSDRTARLIANVAEINRRLAAMEDALGVKPPAPN